MGYINIYIYSKSVSGKDANVYSTVLTKNTSGISGLERFVKDWDGLLYCTQ